MLASEASGSRAGHGVPPATLSRPPGHVALSLVHAGALAVEQAKHRALPKPVVDVCRVVYQAKCSLIKVGPRRAVRTDAGGRADGRGGRADGRGAVRTDGGHADGRGAVWTDGGLCGRPRARGHVVSI